MYLGVNFELAAVGYNPSYDRQFLSFGPPSTRLMAIDDALGRLQVINFPGPVEVLNWQKSDIKGYMLYLIHIYYIYIYICVYVYIYIYTYIIAHYWGLYPK